jgi:hypothetical protein
MGKTMTGVEGPLDRMVQEGLSREVTFPLKCSDCRKKCVKKVLPVEDLSQIPSQPLQCSVSDCTSLTKKK